MKKFGLAIPLAESWPVTINEGSETREVRTVSQDHVDDINFGLGDFFSNSTDQFAAAAKTGGYRQLR